MSQLCANMRRKAIRQDYFRKSAFYFPGPGGALFQDGRGDGIRPGAFRALLARTRVLVAEQVEGLGSCRGGTDQRPETSSKHANRGLPSNLSRWRSTLGFDGRPQAFSLLDLSCMPPTPYRNLEHGGSDMSPFAPRAFPRFLDFHPAIEDIAALAAFGRDNLQG